MLLQGLPAIDYTKYVEEHQYWKFIPDWIMVVFTVRPWGPVAVRAGYKCAVAQEPLAPPKCRNCP